MKLREGERIMKIYHHHPTPFVFDVLKAVAGAFPFFLMLFLFQGALSTKWFAILNVFVLALFALVITYLSLIYWLDKLVVTTQRVIHIDWKYLTIRDEAEALLKDIQDIQSEEKGILAAFRVFDYGTFRLDTASSYVTLEFFNAPNPEQIRQFIYHVKNSNL
ncbi:PH domain-containing protein [Candidatus Peregrinibacteria bacterium]|jgi:hypothetical protein|nr:PH domain-containing protein [Candidatus Peregrinibacteria bacterium]